MAIQPDELRDAMRHWTTGVCVVCGIFEDAPHGMTVNSFTSVSLDPPLVVVTMNDTAFTKNAVERSGLFSVSILKADQQHIADIFSDQHIQAHDRFSAVKTVILPGGTIALKDAMAILECRVQKTIPLNNSTVFLGEVTYYLDRTPGLPLVYHNRGYYSL